MSASALPTVVDALYALALRAQTDGIIDEALYGPTPKGPSSNARSLVIFFGTPGAVSRPTLAQGFDGAVYEEQIDVNCNALSWSGASDPLAIQRHNDAAYQILAYIKARLEDDPTLGGACERATLGQTHTAMPLNDSAGSSVEISFTVRALAYI